MVLLRQKPFLTDLSHKDRHLLTVLKQIIRLRRVSLTFLNFCNHGTEVEIKAIAQLESYGSLHEADTEQNWQHEYCGLLKYKKPCLVEVLLDSGLHVFESLLVFLDHHPRNDVVALIELKLQLFSESLVP